MLKPAIFWDRDGTLIADPGYLNDPEQVALLPGAAQALRRLAQAGFQNIVVSNQSGVARGLLDEPTLERINRRIQELFAAEGAAIEAIYCCPYLDGEEAVVEQYRQDSELRKPRPGLLLQAAVERNIDLAASWSIGNALRDAQAGRAAGCRTILIRDPAAGPTPEAKDRKVDFVTGSPAEAADIVLKHTRSARSVESPSSLQAAAASKEPAELLQEILNFLRAAERKAHAEDFSLAQLAGAIVQILALAVMTWVLFGVIRGEQYLGTQLLFGIFLQMLALTFFILSLRK